jgi:hypothetical protein
MRLYTQQYDDADDAVLSVDYGSRFSLIRQQFALPVHRRVESAMHDFAEVPVEAGRSASSSVLTATQSAIASTVVMCEFGDATLGLTNDDFAVEMVGGTDDAFELTEQQIQRSSTSPSTLCLSIGDDGYDSDGSSCSSLGMMSPSPFSANDGTPSSPSGYQRRFEDAMASGSSGGASANSAAVVAEAARAAKEAAAAKGRAQ